MIRRTIALLLAILVCVINLPVAFAHDEAAEHWQDMSLALFGDKNFIRGQSEEVRNAVWALRYASQLCIDQSGADGGKAQLKRLQELNISGIPKSISEIALYPEHNDHRAYTHQGWDYAYSEFDKPRNPDWSTRRWRLRKDLLLTTAEQVFNFNGMPRFLDSFLGVDEKCDKFCALLYYVHILGDHIAYNHSTYEKGKDQVMPLAGTRGDTIISEMIKCFEVLFPNQDYSELQRELETANTEITKLLNDPGNLNTEEGFNEYHKWADEILREILAKHLPALLKNEEFFKNVFYK